MKSKVLLIFAQKSEAKETIARFKASPVVEETAFIWTEGRISCLYAFDYGWIALSSVGMHAALMTAMKYANPVEEIWNLGLAGRLRGDLPIGELLSIESVSKYIPIFSPDIDEHSFDMSQGIHPRLYLEGKSLLISSDFPIHNDKHRTHLADTFDLVDMEGYGIAYAASSLRKKCKMWKIVSDFATAGGKELIQKNKEVLSKRLADHIECELKGRF